MAHIRKKINKDGTISYVLIVEFCKTADGKRIQKQRTLRGVTRQQAEKSLVEFQHEVNVGHYIVNNNLTLKELIDEWLNVMKATLSPTSYNEYYKQCYNYICSDEGLGHYKIQDINALLIQRFINSLSDKSPISGNPLSAKTISNVYANIHSLFDFAIDLGIIKDNPATRIKLPTRKKREIKILTEAEVSILVEGIQKNPDLKVPVLLALTTGMRRGEVLGLKFSDCDYINNTITIRHNRVKGYDGIVDKTPKTINSEREIVVSEVLIQQIKEKELFCKKKRLQGYPDYNNGNYVCFRMHSGNPWTPDAFSHQYTSQVKALGLSITSFHALRHTFASLCVAQNVDIVKVSKALGHSQTSFTLNTYTHLMNKRDNLIPSIMENKVYNQAL